MWFDWADNPKWDKKDQQLFFAKLKLARDKCCYLKIKAGNLYESGNERNINEAIKLLDLAINDYPDQYELALVYNLLARCYEFLELNEKAIEFYEKSLLQEKKVPNMLTTTIFDYPEFIVENKIKRLYLRAIELLDQAEKEERIHFPLENFLFFGLKAAIYNRTGHKKSARIEAKNASYFAKLRHSGLSRHPNIGIVKGYEWLKKELKQIAK